MGEGVVYSFAADSMMTPNDEQIHCRDIYANNGIVYLDVLSVFFCHVLELSE